MTQYKKALRTGASLTVELKGREEIFYAQEVKGALIWPTAKTPGYFCVFAQKEAPNEAGKAPLVLLCETAEEQPMELFKKMLNHAQDFSCHEWVVDLRRENCDYLNLFAEFSRFHQTSYISLNRARFPGHFEKVTGLVKNWASCLEIGEGVMKSQLAKVTIDDLTQNPDNYFAIKALCLLISDLETAPWRTHTFGQGGVSQGHKNIDRRNSGGWT